MMMGPGNENHLKTSLTYIYIICPSANAEMTALLEANPVEAERQKQKVMGVLSVCSLHADELPAGASILNKQSQNGQNI